MYKRISFLALLAAAAVLVAAPASAATSISVVNGAGVILQGSFSMQVSFDGAGGNAFVQDNSPNNESEYWVAFRVDDDNVTFDPGAATKSFQMLRAFTDDAASATAFRVNLIDNRALTGSPNMALFILPTLNGGGFHPTGTETFITSNTSPNGHSKFLLEWKAATAPGANNGRMVTYRDGVLRKQITNLNNDTIRVGMARFGGFGNTISVQTGTLILDDFVSTRTAQTP